MDYEMEELAWRYAELKEQKESIDLELSALEEKMRNLSRNKGASEEFHLSCNNKILYVGWNDDIGFFNVFRWDEDY